MYYAGPRLPSGQGAAPLFGHRAGYRGFGGAAGLRDGVGEIAVGGVYAQPRHGTSRWPGSRARASGGFARVDPLLSFRASRFKLRAGLSGLTGLRGLRVKRFYPPCLIGIKNVLKPR